MENEELKEKMVKIIINAIWKDAEADCDSTDESEAISIADALIAARSGDVSSEKAMRELAEAFHREKCAEYDLLNYQMQKLEYRIAEAEHHAARAERALDKAVKLFYEYRIESDVLSCSSCWIADEAFKKCEAQGLYKGCPQRWKEEILIQAEKELAEEEKDDDLSR